MTASDTRFGDLGTRSLSAVLLAGLGFLSIWSGGWLLIIFVTLLVAGISYEIANMSKADSVAALVGLSALAFIMAAILPPVLRLPILVAAGLIAYQMFVQQKRLMTGAYLFTMIGAATFLYFADTFGIAWTIWLIALVVATDVAGYFAGKMIGGPKFWPAISPKKTWSGTVAGWGAAALVGVVAIPVLGAGVGLIVLSIMLSFASQLGDIFESFVKRKTGVKDSSGLIPGHGGVWDRFDGMLAGLSFGLPSVQRKLGPVRLLVGAQPPWLEWSQFPS